MQSQETRNALRAIYLYAKVLDGMGAWGKSSPIYSIRRLSQTLSDDAAYVEDADIDAGFSICRQAQKGKRLRQHHIADVAMLASDLALAQPDHPSGSKFAEGDTANDTSTKRHTESAYSINQHSEYVISNIFLMDEFDHPDLPRPNDLTKPLLLTDPL